MRFSMKNLLLFKMQPKKTPQKRLSRKNETRLVAALSRGNISLQMGRYLTKADIEALRKQVHRYE